MRFCTRCGASLPEDAAFCPRCGASVPIRDPDKLLRIWQAEREKDNKYAQRKVRKKHRFVLPALLCLLLVCGLLFVGVCGLPLFRNGWQDVTALLHDEILPPDATPQPTATSVPSASSADLHPIGEIPQEVPHLELRPYLQQLTQEEAENFLALYQSVMTYQEECVLPHAMPVEQVSDLYTLLYCECPEAVHLALDGTQTIYYDNQKKARRISLTYTMNRAEYQSYAAACRKKLDQWLVRTNGMTDWEKQMFVYEELTRSCIYDLNAMHAASAAGALIDRSAKCDGIAHAMQWAMQEMGISCTCVIGREPGEAVGHCWNVITLDGVTSDLDVTMDVCHAGETRTNMYCCVNVPASMLRATYEPDSIHDRFAPPEGISDFSVSYHAKKHTRVEAGQDWEELLLPLCREACEVHTSFSAQFADEAEFTAFCDRFQDTMQKWVDRHEVDGGSWLYWVEPQTLTFGFTASELYLEESEPSEEGETAAP